MSTAKSSRWNVRTLTLLQVLALVVFVAATAFAVLARSLWAAVGAGIALVISFVCGWLSDKWSPKVSNLSPADRKARAFIFLGVLFTPILAVIALAGCALSVISIRLIMNPASNSMTMDEAGPLGLLLALACLGAAIVFGIAALALGIKTVRIWKAQRREQGAGNG